VLFRDGRDLIKHGKLAAGCDKLAASERLESSVGTLLNLGDCRDKLGMTASAWAAFRKAEAMAKRSGDATRQAEASRRAAQVEPRRRTWDRSADRVDGLVVRRVARSPTGAWSTAADRSGSTRSLPRCPAVAWSTTVHLGRRESSRCPARTGAAPQWSRRGPRPGRAETVHPARAPPRTRDLEHDAQAVGGGRRRRELGTGIYFGWHAKAWPIAPMALSGRCADPEGLRLVDQARTRVRASRLLHRRRRDCGAAVLWAPVGPWSRGP
jgi:hypothetical protein